MGGDGVFESDQTGKINTQDRKNLVKILLFERRKVKCFAERISRTQTVITVDARVFQ